MEVERKTVTITEAGEILGIGKSKAYELARAGKLPVLKLGPRLWRVPMNALEKYLDRVGAGA